jgi:hypothetical protein
MIRAGTLTKVLFITCLFAVSAGAETLHVHPGGDDAQPGTREKPVRTIGRAVALAKPGGTVVVAGGVYRETIKMDVSGTAGAPVRLVAADKETVVVTGADVVRDWKEEPARESGDKIFSAPWPYRFITWNPVGTHPADDYHKLIGRAEQVLYLGVPLRQVLEKRLLTRGTFFADLEAKRLHVCAPDNADLTKRKESIEAATRATLLEVRGDWVEVRGIRFRYAANQAQQGAAQFLGNHITVEDCTFEETNASGANFRGQDIAVRRCVFEGNGQLGFGASRAHRLRLEEIVCRNNNTKGFDRQWEAGGNKITLSRGVVIERSTVVNNRGIGIWFDIGNEDCEVRNCLIADNEDAGIFYEISYRLTARDNVIVGNGLANTPGAWGANAGIALSSSVGCVLERNLLVGNREGLAFREQKRTTPRIDDKSEVPVWNHEHKIQNNLFAWNRDAQVWGWWEVERPVKELRLTMRDNLYATRPGQGLFHWGVAWRNPKKFASLAEVQRALDLETGSAVHDIRFGETGRLDFRLPADSPVLQRRCYPTSAVPGVIMGTTRD